jgi:hypothetical protein
MATNRPHRSTAEALTWCQSQVTRPTSDWRHDCLRFVANAYGYSHAGSVSAWEWWHALPEDLCHYDHSAPAGSLMVWKGGTKGYGHVAVSDGRGSVYTSGWARGDRIALVVASAIGTRWHMSNSRWAWPAFPHGVAL